MRSGERGTIGEVPLAAFFRLVRETIDNQVESKGAKLYALTNVLVITLCTGFFINTAFLFLSFFFHCIVNCQALQSTLGMAEVIRQLSCERYLTDTIFVH